MLTEKELKVVDDNYIMGFGNFIQQRYSAIDCIHIHIPKNIYPERERFEEKISEFCTRRGEFDNCYLISLPLAEVNPLQLEGEAWKLLSPLVGQHLDEFGNYVETYTPENLERKQLQQLLAHTDRELDLLQKWKIISQSFSAKWQRCWKYVPEREEATRMLIQELSSK